MTSKSSSESLTAATIKGWHWSLIGSMCHRWPVLRVGTSSGILWSSTNSACSVFSVRNHCSDIGPPACPASDCSWLRYLVRCSTEVSIRAVTPLDKGFLPTILPPQMHESCSFAGVTWKGAMPHPWNWTFVDFNESCVAKSHTTLKLERLNPFCFLPVSLWLRKTKLPCVLNCFNW